MSGDFLTRWSRRKREVPAPEPAPEPAVAPEAAGVSPEADADLAEAIAALPPIETLTSQTDLTQFLRAGIPGALRNAALRRMWSLDHGIRDYVSEAREYAYDWNVAGGVPGQGPMLPTDDVESMLRQVFGGTDPVVEDVAEAPEPGADPMEAAAQAAADSEPETRSEPDEAPLPALSAQARPATLPELGESGGGSADLAEPSRPDETPLRVRRHGGAAPI